MRDRLIELLNGAVDEVKQTCGGVNTIANYLLENGVIVSPCKVGQILYVIEAGLINEAKVKEYKYCSNSNNGVHWHIIFEELFAMSEAHIGKNVFYTREDAQAKLKEGGKG